MINELNLYSQIISPQGISFVIEKLNESLFLDIFNQGSSLDKGEMKILHIESLDTDLILEKIGKSEYLLHGPIFGAENDIKNTIKKVSEKLSELEIKHRIEIYNKNTEIEYLDYNWPK
jgi:hypothetical protein